jgi:hypothetical protein
LDSVLSLGESFPLGDSEIIPDITLKLMSSPKFSRELEEETKGDPFGSLSSSLQEPEVSLNDITLEEKVFSPIKRSASDPQCEERPYFFAVEDDNRSTKSVF